MSEEISLSTPVLNLAAKAWGPPHGPPVLALHGWLDNAASFQPLAEYLPTIRLVALDLPGHGRSDHRPAGTVYHFIDYIPSVIAAADALAWDSFALLGHSLGAGVASFVAAALPARVTHLALIDGIGPVAGEIDEIPGRLRKSLQAQQRLPGKKVPVYADVRAAVKARHEASGLSLAAAELIASRACKKVPGGVTWRSDPRLTIPSPLYLSEQQVQAMLRAIRAPTLLIRSLQGFAIKRPHTLERCACLADVKIVDLPGGHHLHMEQAQAVAEVLRDCWEQ